MCPTLLSFCVTPEPPQKGGLLVIRTANIRSWRFDQDPYHWWAFGCDHRFYFGPRSLGGVLSATNFHVIEILNMEPKERPEKKALRIAGTSFRESLSVLSEAPWKAVRLGGYCRAAIRRR